MSGIEGQRAEGKGQRAKGKGQELRETTGGRDDRSTSTTDRWRLAWCAGACGRDCRVWGGSVVRPSGVGRVVGAKKHLERDWRRRRATELRRHSAAARQADGLSESER